jgi:hypothetical protein
MKSISLILVLAFWPAELIHLSNSFAVESPIVIRDDKPDSLYLQLGSQFPSVCKVGLRGGDGTLIAPQWVITAAHVAEGMWKREGLNLHVYFDNESVSIGVDQVFVHPEFRPMQGGDIALLHLAKPVNSIKPLKLYSNRDEKGKPIVLIGHGDLKTGKGGEWTTDGKKRGATNVIDDTGPGMIIFDFDDPNSATELEGSAGRGDSGGPAVLFENDQPFIVGISSAGLPGKNGPGTYGAIEHYTRVSAYVDWVEKVISSPKQAKALSQQPKAERMGQRQGGNPLPGLGLFLREQDNRIMIGGKADPMVPEAFRSVMFRPPSIIESLNGKRYTSLQEFTNDFGKIKSGESFIIEFTIVGELKKFEGKKI